MTGSREAGSIRRVSGRAGRGITVLTLCAAMLLLAACGGDKAKYGVILLSPNEDAIRTGETVIIQERSEINETFTVTPRDGEETYELATWRVKGFSDSGKAEDYARQFASNVNLYARNNRDGLAIREKPTIDSPRVYKLREGQKIKILSKTKAATVGDHQGHWYRVLTTDGTAGYCFDHYLTIYDRTETKGQAEDPDILRLREKMFRVYRPAGFRSMAESGRIRLEKFDPQYGLFTDFEEKSLEVRMFTYTHTFSFEGIEKEDPDTFTLTGAGVQVRLQAEESLQLVYTRKNENYSPSFVYMKKDEIESLIEEEKKRREKAYAELREAGPLFASSAYGRLRFTGEGAFRWRDFDRLVPRVIPSGASGSAGSGTVTFDHFLNDSLKNEYGGVFSLTFEQFPDRPLLFMYRLEENKLNLEYVPPEKVEEKVVRERASYPLIMVFFASEAQ